MNHLVLYFECMYLINSNVYIWMSLLFTLLGGGDCACMIVVSALFFVFNLSNSAVIIFDNNN